MSLNPDIRDQTYQFFIEEAQELLQVLEAGLLDLRQDHSTPKVHELMRAAHSIKGGAASVELSAIELLAHRLEDFFKALYSDDVNFDQELEGLLLQAYDCLANPLAKQIEQGTYDQEKALLTAEPVFTALEVRLEDALKNADNYIPSANDLGVDIVSSIFEIDVAQALENLQAVVDNPSNYEPEVELQEKLDMFAGFAELFNLYGFGEIVATAQTALNQNQDQDWVLNVIRAIIADCNIGKDLVLAGDRKQGGTVSDALRNLAQSNNDLSDTQIVEINSELFQSELDDLWSTPIPTDSLPEDIFNPVSSNELIEDSFAESFELDGSAINDVFGTIPNHENIENIFGALPHNETAEDVPATSASNELIDFGAENIFDASPDNELVEDIFAEPIKLDNSSSDDIFDVIPDLSHQPENREKAVESITQIFEHLPTVASVPESLDLPTKKNKTKAKSNSQASESTKSPANKIKAVPKLSVRVDLERLDRMNNLVGELTINRNSLSLDNEQLQQNVSELGKKFVRFQEVTRKIREVSDRLVLERHSSGLSSSKKSVASSSPSPSPINGYINESTEFDALEMDNYDELYSSLQEILEEIVQLEESVDDITIFAKQSEHTINDQRQMLSQMCDEMMWVRMLPLNKVLQLFPRTLRDLSTKYRKPVDLKLTGTEVLVDKAVLEKLSDPLLHLIRNGFDHGIESPEVRAEEGKPANGSIEINAYYQGSQTVIEVKDDGKGLDLTQIVNKAIEQGLITSQEASIAKESRLFDLIFEPGFSTASKVSEISGRGVGMNIVRSQIETLKGKITVNSIPGKGSTFTLRLPLTLTIAKLLVCSLGTTAFAIPADSIEEIIIPTEAQIKFAKSQKFLFFNDRLVPVYSLKEILPYNCPVPDIDSTSQAFKTIAAPEDWLAPLLILSQGQQLFALEVKSLLSEQELVIKPYGKAISAPPYTYGCTILGDGSLIPIFDGAALISKILGEDISSVVSAPNFKDEIEESDKPTEKTQEITADLSPSSDGTVSNKPTGSKTIMIIDDSTALRRTMALTLEREGYQVIQKKNGRDGLDGFRNNSDLDLIICDVEMPIMNGFEFLGMRRRDTALSQVPTFMLTSRSGTKHRNLAIQLGADGYFTKPYVEQEFITEIDKIIKKIGD